jgi:hypothetical protein
MWCIRKIRNIKELNICVDMYLSLNDESFLPASRSESIKSFKSLLTIPGVFIRVLEYDSKIVAWIYARPVKLDHLNHNVLQQIYYASSLSGIKAVKAVQMLHQSMYEEALKKKIPYVTSPGSHLDESFTFVRILEKYGWERRGFLAIKKVI